MSSLVIDTPYGNGDRVSKHRQSFNLDLAPADSSIGLARRPRPKGDRRAYLIQVECACRVERLQGDEVVDVYDGVDPVKLLALSVGSGNVWERVIVENSAKRTLRWTLRPRRPSTMFSNTRTTSSVSERPKLGLLPKEERSGTLP